MEMRQFSLWAVLIVAACNGRLSVTPDPLATAGAAGSGTAGRDIGTAGRDFSPGGNSSAGAAGKNIAGAEHGPGGSPGFAGANWNPGGGVGGSFIDVGG